MKSRNLIVKTIFATGLAACLWSSAGILARAQTPAANPPALSPELQEVAKLSQQHIDDDVIINYVKASGKNYKLSADDIITLNNQGVSQRVILTLQTKPAISSSPVPTAISPTTNAEPPAIEPPPLEPAPAVLARDAIAVCFSADVTVPGTLQDNFCCRHFAGSLPVADEFGCPHRTRFDVHSSCLSCARVLDRRHANVRPGRSWPVHRDPIRRKFCRALQFQRDRRGP